MRTNENWAPGASDSVVTLILHSFLSFFFVLARLADCLCPVSSNAISTASLVILGAVALLLLCLMASMVCFCRRRKARLRRARTQQQEECQVATLALPFSSEGWFAARLFYRSDGRGSTASAVVCVSVSQCVCASLSLALYVRDLCALCHPY